MTLPVSLTMACYLAVGVGFAGPANAACAAPQAAASPTAGAPGTAVNLTGRHFASECRDTGQAEPAQPRTAIELAFEQAGRIQVLAVVDADAQYTFAASVAIPSTAAAGPAVLVAQGSGHNPVRTPFTVVKQGLTGPPPPEQQLPLTGPHTATLAVLGSALVLAGTVAARAGRDRRMAMHRRRE